MSRFQKKDKGDDSAEAKKAITKRRKGLVDRYLAKIGCKNKRLELVIRRKIEAKRLRNKKRREHRKKNIKEPEKIMKPITIEDARETDSTFVFSVD